MIDRAPGNEDDLEHLLSEHKIIYVGEDGSGRETFRDLLHREKKARGVSFRVFSDFCGVTKLATYAAKPDRSINCPTVEDFDLIVQALGLQKDHFVTRGLKHRPQPVPEAGSREYWQAILTLGDWILARTEAILESGQGGVQRLSVTAIEESVGKTFSRVYGKTIGDRQKLYQDVLAVPKFRGIELQHRVQDHSKMTDLEYITFLFSVNVGLAQVKGSHLRGKAKTAMVDYYQDRVNEVSALGYENVPRMFTEDQLVRRWHNWGKQRSASTVESNAGGGTIMPSPEPNAPLPELKASGVA